MRFAVFCYDFPHWKTQTGLTALYLNGYKPEVVIGAPWKKLSIVPSKTRIVHKGMYLESPEKICHSYGFNYITMAHEEVNVSKTLDLGIILGARILPRRVIDSFKYGIINLHPGLLPENRGLDNVKWAVVDMIPQGVTAHFINDKVDEGVLIDRWEIAVYKDDTLQDIQFRIQNKEIEMMLHILRRFGAYGIKGGCVLHGGESRKCLPDEEDEKLEAYLKSYKEIYAQRC